MTKEELKYKDVDVQEDSDGKPDFTEGIIYKRALKIAKGAKYDSTEELRAARKQLSFWTKLKLTWKGETNLGRIAGTALDIAELALPAWAARARDLLQSKQTEEKVMSKTTQTSTKAGAIIIAMILTYFGIEVSAEFLSANLSLILQGVTMSIAGVTAIVEVIRNEDKPAE